MGNTKKPCQWNWNHLLFWIRALPRKDVSYYMSIGYQSHQCLDLHCYKLDIIIIRQMFSGVLSWDPWFSEGWAYESSPALLKTCWQEIHLGGNCIISARQKGWITFTEVPSSHIFHRCPPTVFNRTCKRLELLKSWQFHFPQCHMFIFNLDFLYCLIVSSE